MDLTPLFAPRSITVVGASSDPERVAGRPLSFLRSWRFDGPVAAVNPRVREIEGTPSLPTISDVPFVPDVAVVCLPAAAVLPALEACAAHGTRAAIVFAAGFSEIHDGCPDEPAIRALSERSGMLVCGPNGLGSICVRSRFPGTFSSVVAASDLQDGDVAFVTQSGALGIYLYAEAARRGLGFSRWVSTGNEAALGFEQDLDWLAEDDATRVVCGYVEGVREGDAFVRVLERLRVAGKPVVLLKGGQSESGARGAVSHTGVLAGDAEVFTGVLRQTGAIEVNDATELLDSAFVLRLVPGLDRAKGIAIATTSGGGGIIVSDWCERLGLRLADLSHGTVEQIGRVIHAFGSAANPVDFTGNLMNDAAMVGTAVSALAADPDVGATVVFVGVGGQVAHRVVLELEQVAASTSSLICAVWIGAPDELQARLGADGVPVFADVGQCLRAIARASADQARDVPGRGAGHAERPPELFPEFEAKARLRTLGFPVPVSWLVRDRVPAIPVGRYAVKGQVRHAAHKSALGLVELGVAEAELTDALARVRASALAHDVRLDGILIEAMATPGAEALVSLRRDRTFGVVVALGSGGSHTELVDDAVVRRCPVSSSEISDALREVRLFRGERDRGERAGSAQLAALVAALAAEADQLLESLDELELNPVIVTPRNAMIVDAVGIRSLSVSQRAEEDRR